MALGNINAVKVDTQIVDILDIVANVLKKTYGPYGQDTLVENRDGLHFSTKDGYTVLKNLNSMDHLTRVVLDYLRKVSFKLVKEVGDGSTSAIIIANFIMKHLSKFMQENELPPADVLREFSNLSKELTKIMRKNANTDIDANKIFQVASTATNGDNKVAMDLVKIYEELNFSGFINVDISDKDDDYYKINYSMELPRGYIDDLFINYKTESVVKCVLENTKVFICNHLLTKTDIPAVADLMSQTFADMGEYSKLVIIATGFDNEFVGFIKQNMVNAKKENYVIPLCIVELSASSTDQKLRIEDLATYLDADIFEKDILGSVPSFNGIKLGTAKRFEATDRTCSFTDGANQNSDTLEKRKKAILDKINEMKLTEEEHTSIKVMELKTRYNKLNLKTATYYVGGSTSQEKENRKFLIEDAALATRSALENGVVPASNTEVLRIITEIFDKNIMEDKHDILEVIFKAYKDAYLCLLNLTDDKIQKHYESSLLDIIRNEEIFDLRKNEFVNIKDTNVLNSVKTDIEILNAALSIVSLLVNTNQFISIGVVV